MGRVRTTGLPGTANVTLTTLTNLCDADVPNTVNTVTGSARYDGTGQQVLFYHFASAGVKVSSADLGMKLLLFALTFAFNSATNGSFTARVHVQDADWDPTTLTYNTMPALGTVYTDSNVSVTGPTGTPSQTVSFAYDLGSAGTVYGLAVKIINPVTISSFASGSLAIGAVNVS